MDPEKPHAKRTSPASTLQEQRDPGPAASPQIPPPPPLPWYTEGFFRTTHPAVRRARIAYLRVIALATLLIILTILTVLSIYWGAMWHPTDHVHNLTGLVVDYDGGQVGAFVAQAFMNQTGLPTEMDWRAVPASSFMDEAAIVHALVEEETWAIVAINSGATDRLMVAVAAGDASYNGSSAVSVFAEQARNENAYDQIILPTIQEILQQASQRFAMRFTQQLLSSNQNVTNIASSAPSVVLQPIGYTVNNVRPFDVPVASAVDFVGLIYLLILAYILTLFHFGARAAIQDRLTLRALLLMRIIIPVIAYFIISCFYSLLNLAFQVPFNRWYGHSGFVIYWMMSWLGMAALGLAVEAMITLLTIRFVPFFLVLWLIVNVSVCFYPIPLLPGVFRYGYATPFYNVQRAVRTVVFGTKNQLGLNFGVQIAWIAVSLVSIVLFQAGRRWEERRLRERGAKEEA